MAAETLVPDGLLTATNLSGGLSAINADDTTWLTADSDNADSVCIVSFPTPTGNPTTGAGLQNFTVKYRVTANASSVTFDAYLLESGTRINGGAAIDTWSSTSTAGATREITWDASLLGTADGSAVELEIYATKVGGSPSNRTAGEFQFIDWDVDYSAGATPKAVAGTISMTGALTKKPNKILSGNLSLTGQALKTTKKLFSGTLSLTGQVLKSTKKALQGALSFLGTVTGLTVFVQSLAGTMGIMTGTVSPLGLYKRILTGEVTFTGTLLKKTKKVLGGNLVLIGTIIRNAKKIMGGSLGLTGQLTALAAYKKTVTGLLTGLVGSVTTQLITVAASVKKARKALYRYLGR